MQKNSVLIVDDEADLVYATAEVLKDKYIIFKATTGHEALGILEKHQIDVIILDINLPDIKGFEVLRLVKENGFLCEVIILTALSDTDMIIKVIKLGAYDYLVKPYDIKDLSIRVNHAAEKVNLTKENIILKDQLATCCFENIIGKSSSIKKVFTLVQKISSVDSTVLITGETGTGKDLLAKAIHNNGKRRNEPFITLDSGGLPFDLLESELFGYKKGAFTGAFDNKLGKFELANEGTLFLDEIGNMPLAMQSKVLRIIQEKEITRLGDTKIIPVDVRIIAATNLDLQKSVESGDFRLDLYHRLKVIHIHLPPLRERNEDIPLLVEYFLDKYNKKLNKKIQGVHPEVMMLLKKYPWPGNIRELAHFLERIVILEEGNEVTLAMLPPGFIETFHKNIKINTDTNKNFKDIVNEYEKNFIEAILKKNDFNQTKTAKALGISRTTLISKIRNLGIYSN